VRLDEAQSAFGKSQTSSSSTTGFGKIGKYGLNIDNLNPIQHFEGLFALR